MFTGLAVGAAVAEMKEKKKAKQASDAVLASRNKTVVKSEIKENEEVSPKEEFKCEICPALFNRRYNRDRHMELIHKVPRPGRRPPLFLGKHKITGTQANGPTTVAKPIKPPKKPIHVVQPSDVFTDESDVFTSGDEEIVKPIPKKKAKKENKEEITAVLEVPMVEEIRAIPEIPIVEEIQAIPEIAMVEEAEEDEEEEEEEVMFPTTEEKKSEIDAKECNDNVNLIQMPVGKEVVVTVFITSK